MKKSLPLLCVIILLHISTQAQSLERSVIGASGGSFSGSSFEIDYTVGESITANTTSSGSFYVYQGFQQAANSSTSIKELDYEVSYKLYPNPCSDQVSITFGSPEPLQLKLSVCDATGKTIFLSPQTFLVQQQHTENISLKALSSGIYFVNVYNKENTLLKSIRFVKQ